MTRVFKRFYDEVSNGEAPKAPATVLGATPPVPAAETVSTPQEPASPAPVVTESAPARVWYADLPPDLHADVAAFDSPERLARGYVAARNLAKVDPSQVVTIPKEGDAEGQLAALRRLGAPGDTGYTDLKIPQGFEKQPVLKHFEDRAQKMGLLPSQVQHLVDWFAESVQGATTARQEQIQQQHQQNLELLQSEMGTAFPENSRFANAGVDALGGDALLNVLNEAGLGTNPVIIRALAKVGRLVEDDSIRGRIGAPASSGNLGRTPEYHTQKGQEYLRQAMQPGVSTSEQRELGRKAQECFAEATRHKKT